MTKRALLIAINSYPNFSAEKQLHGCLNDVDLIKEIILETWFGFSQENVVVLSEKEQYKPTRENIVTALNQLAEVSTEDDLVFIHFSGHGSRLASPNAPSGYYETIVPCDSGRNPPTQPNRDILDTEISEFLKKVGDRKASAVFNFDCCHSGHITRSILSESDDENRGRSIEADETLAGGADMDDSFRSMGHAEVNWNKGHWLAGGHPYVLMAACRATETAKEMPHPFLHNQKIGAWTHALYQAVRQAFVSSSNFSYRSVSEEATFQVHKQFPTQNPIVEGTLDNEFLGSVLLSRQVSIKVLKVEAPGKVELSAGANAGITVNSKLAICPRDSTAVSENRDNILATATVVSVSFGFSYAALDTDQAIVQPLCAAFIMELGGSSLATEIRIESLFDEPLPENVSTQLAFLRKGIWNDPFLFIADEQESHGLPLPEPISLACCNTTTILVIDPNAAVLKDRFPTLSFLSSQSYLVVNQNGEEEIEKFFPISDLGTKELLAKLEKLGNYHRGLAIHNPFPSFNPLKGQIQLEILCRPDPSKQWMLLKGGEELSEDFQMSIKVTNHSKLSIFVAVLEYAEDGEVDMLFPPEGGQEILGAHKILSIGEDHLDGLSVISRAVHPRETIKVFASTEPATFELLLQEAYRDGRGNLFQWLNEGKNSLQAILQSVGFRKILKKTEVQEHWFTVEQQILLRRKNPLEQLMIEHFSVVQKIVDPEEFLKLLQFTLAGHPTLSLEEEIKKTFGDEIKAPLMLSYVQAIWWLDPERGSEAEKMQCHFCQRAFEFLKPMLPQELQVKCLHNLAVILLREKKMENALKAIDIMENCTSMKQENDIDDLADSLFLLGNAHLVCTELSVEEHDEALKHGKKAIETYEATAALYQASGSTKDLLDTLYNQFSVIKHLQNHHCAGSNTSEIQDMTSNLLHKTEVEMNELDITNIDLDIAKSCLDIGEARMMVTRDMLKVPWQEDIISICLKVQGSFVIPENHPNLAQWNYLLGEAYGDRLVGNKLENLHISCENYMKALEFYQLRDDMCNMAGKNPYATTAINMATSVIELNDMERNCDKAQNWAREISVHLERICQADASGQLTKLQARYNYLKLNSNKAQVRELEKFLQECETYRLSTATNNWQDHRLDEVIGCTHGDIALKVMSESFHNPSADDADLNLEDTVALAGAKIFGKHQSKLMDLPVAYQNFKDIRCTSEASCCHTDQTEQHLQLAITKLPYLPMDQIRYRGLLGRYYATHCKLSEEQRYKKVLDIVRTNVQCIEQEWPAYNAQAQIAAVNNLAGAVWEDAIDVAINLFQLTQNTEALILLLEMLQVAKSRNTLIATSSDSCRALYSGTLSGEYAASSALVKEAPKMEISTSHEKPTVADFTKNLKKGEVAIQWWMSVKAHSFCLMYNDKTAKVFNQWTQVETLNLYRLCEEISRDGMKEIQMHRLAKHLIMKKLAKFVEENFPGTEKLILVPHTYFHYVPLHTLPFEDLDSGKLTSLVAKFPGGVSYLPNSAFLRNRDMEDTLFSNDAKQIVLFQADPTRKLRFSQAEVHNIENMLNNRAGDQFAIETHTETTVEMFIESCARLSPHILHLACHCTWDNEDLGNSYLQLTPSKETPDGQLGLQKLKQLNFSSCQLVVLSACNTGLREVKTTHMTDINVGFGAQLLASGCKNVILTMAPIPDKLTAEIMVDFYHHCLISRYPISRALRNAVMRETTIEQVGAEERKILKKKKEPTTPVDISPFIHIGIN